MSGRRAAVATDTRRRRARTAGLLLLLAAVARAQSDLTPPGAPATFPEANELPGPPVRPSEARGRSLYDRACTSCHGDGTTTTKGTAVRLGDPGWRTERTPAEAFEAIRRGPGHGGGTGERLGLQQAWDVTTYVWSLDRPPGEVEVGRRTFAIHCADCHGAAGDGIGAAVEERPPSWSDFSLAGTLATDSDAGLEDVIAAGLPEFGMPAFAEAIDPTERHALVAFLRALPFAETYLATGARRTASWRSPRLPASDDAPPAARPGWWIASGIALIGVVAWRVRRGR